MQLGLSAFTPQAFSTRLKQPMVSLSMPCELMSEMLDDTTLQGGYLLALSLSEDDRNFDDKADILDINGFGETWQVLPQKFAAYEPPV